MLVTLLAISATVVSALTSWPQVILSWRAKHRHDIAVLALAGSLFVSGSWLFWSIRVGEPLAAGASAFAFIGHALVLARASGNRLKASWAPVAIAVMSVLPLAAVEIVTSVVALLTLIPHLTSAMKTPGDVSPARWYLEAGEELLWGAWALAVAAPVVAVPSLVYVPVAILIALSASARKFNATHAARLGFMAKLKSKCEHVPTYPSRFGTFASTREPADRRTIAELNLSVPSQPPGPKSADPRCRVLVTMAHA